MTVYFWIDDLGTPGGMEKAVVTWVDALSRAHHTAGFVVHNRGESFFPLPAAAPVHSLPLATELSARRNPWGLARKIFAIHRFLRAHPGLHILNKSHSAVPAALTTMLGLQPRGTRFAYISHLTAEGFNQRFSPLTRRLLSAAFDWVAVTTPPSDPNLTELLTPVEIPTSPPPQKENLVLMIGRLDENKNAKLLLEAWHALGARDWRLQIYGDGNERPALEELITRRALANVELLPPSANLSPLFDRAKILVSASRSETQGLTMFEAMAHRVAVISAPHESAQRFIQPGTTGLLTRDYSPAAMAENLDRLMTDHQLLERISQNGFSWCSANLSVDKKLEEFLRLLPKP